ncbi:MAG TPA: TonB-dependent receptor [Hyphomonas sp.]|nr:TonB-dependent receptor [Hyphomonas sp.]
MSIRSSVSLLTLTGVLAGGVVALPAQAQEILSGRVVDSNGSPLPGAKVEIRAAGLSTSTDREGSFIFQSVPAGDLAVQVDYLGFPGAERTVAVVAGTPSVIVVTLGEDALALERVVVQGAILDGQARALNQQRTAANTTSVVSSDAIGRFPDYNVAEALQRVPGFAISRDQGEGRTINLRGAPSDFTAITVDGVAVASPNATTRAVDLDTVPSDIVSAIEVSKTLLPNQDADSIAGSVNLVTRSAFDRRGPQAALDLGISQNEIDNKADYKGSLRVSNTFGPDEQFGFLASASYSVADRALDNIESAWVRRNDGSFAVEQILFKDYDTKRTRESYTGAFDFRPDDLSKYYVRGTYSKFEDDEYRNQLLLQLSEGTLQPGNTDLTGTWVNPRIEKELRHRTLVNEIRTVALGGENIFSALTMDYQLSFNTSESSYPQRDQLLFRSSLRPAISYDYTDANNPVISLFSTNQHLNSSSFAFRQLDARAEDQKTDEWSARVNFMMPSVLFGNAAEYRFGAAYRDREVSRDENRWRSRAAGLAPTQTFPQLLTIEPSTNFGYNLGFKLDPRLVDAYLASIRATLQSDPNRRVSQSIEGDFSAEESISAAYGMADFTVGNTEVIAGLRVEQTDFSSTAYRVSTDTGASTPLENSNDYTTVFPNLTLRHEFGGNLVGRFALTRGLNRPSYPDVVARVSAGDTPPLTVSRGNPDLKPTISNNLDAGLEYYMPNLGIIAVNGFYKQLEDFAYTNRITGAVFEGSPATIIEVRNSDEGYIAGVEFNWAQNFKFQGVPGSFGIMANVTLADSEVKLGSAATSGRSKAPLEGQSDYVGNLAVFWENERSSIRLSYNDRGDYVDALNLEDAALDLYWQGRDQLDLSASYEFSPRFEMYLEAKNLTDTEGLRYFGSTNRVYERERFGRTTFLGARFKY